MEELVNYSKDDVYVVGVSGGPDSMALLDMLFKQGLNIVVCLVNYNTRTESSIEQEMVKEYCFQRGIIFETINVIYYKEYGNFEAWARDVRYCFFKEVSLKTNAKGVFVAHHKDDHLETYLIQKQRKNITKVFGLKQESELLGMKVIRPLLKYSKEELINYCKTNSIPYSIDSTNLSNKYLRNKIRNTVLSKMSSKEKESLLIEIEEENKKRESNLKTLNNLMKFEKIPIEEFLKIQEVEKQLLIYELIVDKVPEAINRLSWYRINDLIRILKSERPNVCIKIYGKYYFIREYNSFYVDILEENYDYSYVMDRPSLMNTKEFSCDFRCDTSQLKINNSSYPLTIRNVKENDKVTFGNVTKRVNRLLIDEKVALRKRKMYPVVVDNKGKIVYIPLYRSEIQKTIAYKLKFMLK